MHIRLGTRGSALALAQSGQMADALRQLGHEVDLVVITTLGDISTAPLDTMGGTGVFATAIRRAMLEDECDIAVHSLKDLPTAPYAGLTIPAIPVRASPWDVLCARDGLTLAALPVGASIGTGSPRRRAQLSALRPDLVLKAIRGNVATRLRMVTDGTLDAVVLAEAGLQRLGLTGAITQTFGAQDLLPAPGQGALAIECRAGDSAMIDALTLLDDSPTRLCVTAERQVLQSLEAGCSAPVGALAQFVGNQLGLVARVVKGDVREDREVVTVTTTDGATALGALVAGRLLELPTLHGLNVLMPARRDGRLSQAIQDAGATVTTVSLTEITPLMDLSTQAHLAALATGSFDWVAITSATTLDVIGDLLHVPDTTKVAVVGPGTASAARRHGLRVDLQPESGGGGEALAQAWPEGAGRVLIPGAADPSPVLAAALSAAGWQVTEAPVYRVTTCALVPEQIRSAWQSGDFHALVVTAGSTARAAAALLGVTSTPVIAIGEPSAKAARELGFHVAATAVDPDGRSLAKALESLAGGTA